MYPLIQIAFCDLKNKYIIIDLIIYLFITTIFNAFSNNPQN